MKNLINCKTSLIFILACQITFVSYAEEFINGHSGINDKIATLQEQITRFVSSAITVPENVDVDINVADLDPRLKLSSCDNNLTYTFTQNVSLETLAGRHTINIQCRTATPWSIYIPVNIDVWKEIPILLTTVKRGETIHAQDVSMQRCNLAKLQGKFVDTMADVIGKSANRSLAAGSALYPDQLITPDMIKKGDTVVLTLQTGSITVSASGTAKQSGKQGDQISVDNLTSNRTVTGRIIDRNTVSISL